MKHSLLLWIIAFVITAASAVFQFVTGPSYPLKGSVIFNGKSFSYRLSRSHAGSTDCPVSITTDDEAIHGVVEWRRFTTDDPWTRVELVRHEGALTVDLPQQPPAGKLEYRISLMRETATQVVPAEGTVVVRFRGDVPWYILIPHILAMFSGMLFSARAGIASFRETTEMNWLIVWTIGFLFIGGLVLGPVVQNFAFGRFWTGWPVGHDLTDNKTAVALAAWLTALGMMRWSGRPQRWVLAAAIITLLVYLIPHSVLGSEIDYRKADTKSPTSSMSPEISQCTIGYCCSTAWSVADCNRENSRGFYQLRCFTNRRHIAAYCQT